LMCDIQITYSESLLGFRRVLKQHPSHKKICLKRTNCVQNGSILRVIGLGMPKLDKSYGDLLIRIIVTEPEKKEWSVAERLTIESLFGTVKQIDIEDAIIHDVIDNSP
jgi:DnaJ-class molecular chaperone